MRYTKIILPALATAALLTSCDDQIMEWKDKGGVTSSEIPLEVKEVLANYDDIKTYAQQYMPNTIIGIGMGADLYVNNTNGEGTLANANYAMFTPGNAMKGDALMTNSGGLNFTTVDKLIDAFPDGIHELATPGWHSTTVARRLVVSCTAFSPLPPTVGAVVLFCHCSPLPTTCIFTSRMPYVARTFLSRSVASASDRPEHCFRLANLGNFFGLRIAATKNLALFFCFNARWFGGEDRVCETLSKKVGAPLPFGNAPPRSLLKNE